MKIRKRYILLIIIATLPLLKLIHPEDYCFGDGDLFIIGVFVVLFTISFIAILFNNLYIYTLKKELFNFRPIIIAVIYASVLIFLLKYHNQSILKNQIQIYNSIEEVKNTKLFLFDDSSFELKIKKISEYNNAIKSDCYKKGIYSVKGDTLFLNFNDKRISYEQGFDTIYIYNATKDSLKSMKNIFSGFKILK